MSAIVYKDSKLRNERHELEHLLNTFQIEVKGRKEVKDRINNNPDILKKHHMVVPYWSFPIITHHNQLISFTVMMINGWIINHLPTSMRALYNAMITCSWLQTNSINRIKSIFLNYSMPIGVPSMWKLIVFTFFLLPIYLRTVSMHFLKYSHSYRLLAS